MARVKIGPASLDRKSLDVEITRLRDLDAGALRASWRNVFGRQPPAHLPRHLLFRMLAYRLQADHLGDLDSESRRLLDGAVSPGRIFDDCGNRMSPSHARKRGTKYRYYISSALVQGQEERAGTVGRVPANEIETLVVRSVRSHLSQPTEAKDDATFIHDHVVRVEIGTDRLFIDLAGTERPGAKRKRGQQRIEVPWQKMPSTRRREILAPESMTSQAPRSIRSESRTLLVASIARGRRWLEELTTNPSASAETIATRESCSVRKVSMTVSLAFLAPDLVKAAIEGRLPHGMGVARLCELPAEWSRQRHVLGLRAP